MPDKPPEHYRFLALDMDGTILDASYGVSPAVLAALDRIRASGRRIVVSTGRVYASALPHAAKFGGGDGYVCSNGAEIYDAAGRAVARTLLPESAARALVEVSRRFEAHFHGFVGDEWRYETERPSTEFYTKRSGLRGARTDFDEMETLGFTKCLFIDQPESLVHIERAIARDLGDAVRTVRSAPSMLEVMAPGVGKASGLATCLAQWGGTLDEAVAFGDAENDEDMLLAAGIGVAMGNSPASLKERVGRVAASVDDDGVARWLSDFFGFGLP